MLSFNEEQLKDAIISKAVDEIVSDINVSEIIKVKIGAAIDKLFADNVGKIVAEEIAVITRDGFNREYQRIDAFGGKTGEPTTIRKELEKVMSGYWSQRVDKRTGNVVDRNYESITRAEYLMTQICAEDFSAHVKQSALNVTGALKDGMRNQLGTIMDGILNDLFRVKSLQDQGKVEKPW